MRVEGFEVVQAAYAGEGLFPRGSLEMGDYVIVPGARWLVQSVDAVKAFYEALCIELWSDWRWIELQ